MSTHARKATSVQKIPNQKHNKRIYNRFTDYSTEDCYCIYCLYYDDREKTCSLDKCCCAEERMEARKREQNVQTEKIACDVRQMHLFGQRTVCA